MLYRLTNQQDCVCMHLDFNTKPLNRKACLKFTMSEAHQALRTQTNGSLGVQRNKFVASFQLREHHANAALLNIVSSNTHFEHPCAARQDKNGSQQGALQ